MYKNCTTKCPPEYGADDSYVFSVLYRNRSGLPRCVDVRTHARNQRDHLDLFFGLPWTSFSFKSGAQMAAAESMSFAVGKMVLMFPRLTMSKSGKCNVEYGRVDIDQARLRCHACAKHQ